MNYFLCFMTLFFSHFSIGSAKISGFGVDLIHCDSKISPFYNPSSTPSELAINRALLSIARANQLYPSNVKHQNGIETSIIPDHGSAREYLMKISIGTPPVETFAIVDTGSDFIWLQCKPCSKCYQQNLPLFDPRKSSTFTKLSCGSIPCQNSVPDLNACSNPTDACPYTYSYYDGSYTQGVLATETFTFQSACGQGRASFLPNLVFGCGYNNSGGTFDSNDAGLVGLAGGPLSLVSQLGDQIDKKFSYCLLPPTANSASKLKFGSDAFLPGQEGIVSTPLILRKVTDTSATFYFLTLEAISVGKIRIENPDKASKEGNIIIDSGTTLNFLQTSLFQQVAVALTQTTDLQPVQDPRGVYSLCFDKNSFRMVPLPQLEIVFHFTGADVVLKPLNMFIELDYVTCLMVLPTNGPSFYGNVAQVNFQVQYDLTRKLLSFLPADCTQQ